MNTGQPFHNSRKIVPFDAVPAREREDFDSYARQRDVMSRTITEMQWARIINASCKAFLIRRGLDVGTDGFGRASQGDQLQERNNSAECP